jgi:hypothetical protein
MAENAPATPEECPQTGSAVSALRLTVTPWFADRLVETGAVPESYAAFQRLHGLLFACYMEAAYLATGGGRGPRVARGDSPAAARPGGLSRSAARVLSCVRSSSSSSRRS